MKKRHIFVIILLIGLLMAPYPSCAQVAHEDPDSLETRLPYDADRRLALSLQQMFGSLDSFMAHLNASDFASSRGDVERFSRSYAGFLEVYRRSSLNGSEMEAIASQLEFMGGDLADLANRSGEYEADLALLEEYLSGGDRASAAQLAARMQLRYRDLGECIGKIHTNSTHVYAVLENTSVNTTGLRSGIVSLKSYTAKIGENNRKPSSLLGNATLALVASSGEVATGDRLTLTAILRTTDSVPFGRRVVFYVDGFPAGSAITDSSGMCSLAYTIDGRSFNRAMYARAELDTAGDSLFPAESNVLEIARRPEPALLRARVSSASAAYGDTVDVYGWLATASGLPASRQAITIYVAGAPAGSVTAGDDGRFLFPLAVGHGLPAGTCSVYASYESPPESALLSAASEPDTLAIAPGTSLLTLDPPQPAYFGGERATFNGSLASGTGRPVAGADVGVFAGEVLLGRGRTDAGGLYSVDTAVPFDMSPGQHEVRASFDPGEGRALAGSSSQVHVARFEPAVPRVTITGLPSVAFPGDELDLQGTVLTIDGTPLDGRQVSLVISGNMAGVATTDARGGYRLTRRIEGGPGVYRISVGLQGEGLLMGADRHAGTLLIMPMDRAATVAAAVAAVLAAGLAYLAAMRGKRARAPMPRPAALPGPVKRPAASGLEDALGKVGTALSGGGDRREAVMSIYQAARTMLRERDPALPASATHRELYHILSARLPPLATPLSIITNRYERAAFGHLQPTDEDVASSLWGLGEIRELLYGDGGPGR